MAEHEGHARFLRLAQQRAGKVRILTLTRTQVRILTLTRTQVRILTLTRTQVRIALPENPSSATVGSAGRAEVAPQPQPLTLTQASPEPRCGSLCRRIHPPPP
jgi:hypothetical protein